MLINLFGRKIMRGMDALTRRPRRLRWQPTNVIEPTPGSNAPSGEVDVGSSLRRLREEHGLTIRALSEKSGLAVNTLSLIENSKSSPSVNTLQQLAIALEVPITAFFESEKPESKVAFVKAGQRSRAAFDHGILEDLGAGASIQAVEPLFVTLEPGAGSGLQDIVHTGYEFVYCLEGRILYTIENQSYLIEPGDSLLFEAHLPHRWQNVSPSKSQSLLVLYPTDERDHPTERHFTPG
jgi:transcriptional regulator with XRE-family HTH domain